ncbi:prenyltransferase/squalene oxidase repeat-containing protein [Microbispora sp. CA-102843]|uniref:prenyltransferase/squalene oxidase repeat-containing protein n=1 Tax=Microbispora sp. CA-102843 TaxID=3239952 RepID=UPI003D906941
MSVNDLALGVPPVDTGTLARELVSGLMLRPWGEVSASVYETGRVVALAPWLTGHAERVDYLLARQRTDGAWGAPDGYELVPTLSATEALLSRLRHAGDASLSEPVTRGLLALSRVLSASGGLSLPDTPAVELVVPSLIALIEDHLREAPDLGLPSVRLAVPPGMDAARLARLRGALRSGADVPQKLLHALEVAGEAACHAPGLVPTAIGTVGASPAAAAAWLGDRAGWSDRSVHPRHPLVRRHLEAVARRYGGPVPVGLPITFFERSWVLSWLARAGVPFDAPPEMVADLCVTVGQEGTAAGAGLPPDADTTSVVLYALALLGVRLEPESLLAYESETCFHTWPGEQGFSTSVNAHVLDAFGAYVERHPEAAGRYEGRMVKLARLLRDHQQADGSWSDRWHASPYYATVSCALALHEFGGADSAAAVRRAVRWVLGTQHEDGSWGRWTGTREETAYALQILLMTGSGEDERRAAAAARGYLFLTRSAGTEDPALWHDKDLYLPGAVVRAAVLASCHMARRDPAVLAAIQRSHNPVRKQ